MARRFVLAEETKPRVILEDAPKPRVDEAGLARALGASVVVPSPSQGGSPVTWYGVREEVARRLKSKGGRPGLPGSEPRKVPLTEEDWRMVRELAAAMSEPGFHPSAGQVAGVLLGRAVREAKESLVDQTKRELREVTAS